MMKHALLMFLILFFVDVSFGQETFILNGLPEAVQMDTVTPGNSKPLPIGVLDSSGAQVNVATEETLADVEAELVTANASLVTIDAVLDSSYLVQQNIESEMADANVSLGSIDTKLTSTNSYLSSMDTTLTSADGYLSSIDTKLTTTNSSLNSVDTKLTTTNTSLGSIDTKLTSTNSYLSTITTEVGEMNLEVKDINSKTPSLGQAVMDDSVPVAIASDQSPLPTSTEVFVGAFDQITNLSTVAQTLTAPAGAVGFKIQAPSTNTQNIVWRVNGTATSTEGILMEPGRSEDFDVGSDVSVIAVSGTQTVTIQWKVKQ